MSSDLVMEDFIVEKKKVEVDTLEKHKNNTETIATELHFELLKQYAWLSSAAIGAIIVLVKLNAIEVGDKFTPRWDF